MFSSSFEKDLIQEANIKKNYLSYLIWQIIVLSFWIFWIIAILFLLLEKRTFWLGVLGTLIVFGQIKYLNKNRKPLPKEIKGLDNLWQFLSKDSKNILTRAYLNSLKTGRPISLSLLEILGNNRQIQKLFLKLDVKKEDLKKEIQLINDLKIKTLSSQEKIIFLEQLVEKAAIEANLLDESEIKPSHLFLGLLYLKDKASTRLTMHLGLNWQDIISAAQVIVFRNNLKTNFLKEIRESVVGLSSVKRKIKHRVINRSWTSVNTPFLDQYSTDLTDLARQDLIGFIVGHNQEYKQLVNALSRSVKNNALLIGQNGIGKRSLIEHLAWQIVNDQVPKKLFDKRLVEINLTSLLAGTQTEGEIRARAEKIIAEIAAAKNIILYIPDINQMFQKGELSILTSIFLPYFQKSFFQTIGTISNLGLKEIEKNQDFVQTFEKIWVKEIGPLETLKVLILYGTVLERKEKVEISLKAFKKIISLAKIYNPSGVFPSVAIELLSEAIKEAEARDVFYLTADFIEGVVEEKTNIPLKRVNQIEAEKLLDLENEIHKTFIDQEEAVEAVAGVLRSYRAGLKSSKGPIANFLFVGPTGVGKTQLSKTLARILFSKEDQMIRFDMSKYQDSSSIKKFIGSDDGQAGELSEAILNKPYSILLLDEFEKASPEILNLFLPILDEGKIKDNFGRNLNFSNSLIIATSNAHSQYIFDSLNQKKSFDEISFNLKNNLLTKDFSPELLNRFNEVVVFKPLSKKDIRKIAFLLLKPLEKEVSEKYRYSLSFSEKALDALIEKGYSKEFGARPLKHTIEKEIRNLLAEEILKNNWPANTNLLIDWQENQFYVKILA